MMKFQLNRPTMFTVCGTAVLGAVALGLIASGPAHSQAPLLQIIPLAQGVSLDKKVGMRAHGPSDILQAQLVFQPGGDTGWHTHPGPVVVVVKTGALTEYESNGCIVVHPTGSVFFEEKDAVHRAVNETGGVVEVYATFISPAGSQPLIPASDPGPGTCRTR
jgi:quercetin dioxygenase-like cupin family protein